MCPLSIDDEDVLARIVQADYQRIQSLCPLP